MQIHYEGGGSRTPATDIVCPMYARVHQVLRLADDPGERCRQPQQERLGRERWLEQQAAAVAVAGTAAAAAAAAAAQGTAGVAGARQPRVQHMEQEQEKKGAGPNPVSPHSALACPVAAETRPVILCEYAHSMGNSTGNVAKYWEAFEAHPHAQVRRRRCCFRSPPSLTLFGQLREPSQGATSLMDAC